MELKIQTLTQEQANTQAIALSKNQVKGQIRKPVRAIIFFAHGSRDPLWRLPIEAIAQRAQALDPAALVRCAYLELTPPALPSVTAELAALGVTQFTILPLFLGVGKHAREDLPTLLAAIRQNHPEADFKLLPSIGEDPRLVDLAARLAVFPAVSSSVGA